MKTLIEDCIAQALNESGFTPGTEISIKNSTAVLFDLVLEHINTVSPRNQYRAKNKAAAYGALKRWVQEYTKTYLEPVAVPYDVKTREQAPKHTVVKQPQR